LKSNERVYYLLSLVEHIKEPIEQLNVELNKLMNEDVPNNSYIKDTPEYDKLVNFYIGLPTWSSLEELAKELKQLDSTLKHYKTGVH
jgi:hypothetical protein